MKSGFSGEQDVYLEIAQRYREYIRLGVLRAGERLPSVRTAAGELGVNPNTVARAYAVLESEGCLIPEDISGDFTQFVSREGQGGRIARSEGNDGGIGERLENLTDRGRLECGKLIGNSVFHMYSIYSFDSNKLIRRYFIIRREKLQ